MARIILAIVAFVLVMAILKMVIIALVLAGLIFRTKETVGLLLIGGCLALLAAQPLISFGLLALIAIGAFIKNGQKAEETSQTDAALQVAEAGPDKS